MDNGKKELKKSKYDLNSISNNIYQEFHSCISIKDGRSRSYEGILLYGINDLSLLNDLRNKISNLFKDNNLDYLVISSPTLPNEFPNFNRNDKTLGYQIIDVGWFIQEGWLKVK